MSLRLRESALLVVLLLAGCGEEDGGPSAAMQIDTLLQNLEYPTGMWLAGGAIYFTETAGKNTAFGGKVRLNRYVISSGALSLVVDQPANSDAVVVSAAGDIYLASYQSQFPGDEGAVSVVDGVTSVETPVTGLEIAAIDMALDPNQDIYVLGASDTPDAASLYRLSAGDYADTTVVKRGLGRSFALARFGGETYFADLAGIWRLDGTGTVIPLLTENAVRSLAVASGLVYFADFGGGYVSRLRLSTGVVDTLIGGLISPASVRHDAAGKRLFFLTSGTGANQYKDGILGVIHNLP